MIDSDSFLQQRFNNRRAGLQLVAIEDAALPVTVVGCDVLIQEKKHFPLLHEFLLRLIDSGVSTPGQIAKYLGVDRELVDTTVAEQIAADNLFYTPTDSKVHLSARGKMAAQDLESVQASYAQLQLTFDRTVWGLADYGRRSLISKREAEEQGMVVLPASRTSRIGVEDITAQGMNSLLRQREGKELKREVLSVRKVRPDTHRYFPAKLLVYADASLSEVELGLVVDDEESSRHEAVLNELGGVEHLGVRVAEAPPRPSLPAELESERASSEEVAPLRLESIGGRALAAEREAASLSDPSPTSQAEVSLADIDVRSVSVFEHRELLAEALKSASRRLLIISPWVRSAVVDQTFVSRLETRLRSGVTVCIAYGIGPDDKGSDSRAIARLVDVQRKHKQNFRLVRLQNSHAKVLIFDDKWISTSFNWLSFKGDPDRTYRMEEGTLVKIPGQVTSQYNYYLDLVDQQEAST